MVCHAPGAWQRFRWRGQKEILGFLTTHSTLDAQFAERIGLPEEDCAAIRQGYEQWDGKGSPNHLRGEAIGLPATGPARTAGRGIQPPPG